jgi:hypothetical protein
LDSCPPCPVRCSLLPVATCQAAPAFAAMHPCCCVDPRKGKRSKQGREGQVGAREDPAPGAAVSGGDRRGGRMEAHVETRGAAASTHAAAMPHAAAPRRAPSMRIHREPRRQQREERHGEFNAPGTHLLSRSRSAKEGVSTRGGSAGAAVAPRQPPGEADHDCPRLRAPSRALATHG